MKTVRVSALGTLPIFPVGLVLFMLVPNLALFEIWPLSSALTTGFTLLCVGIFFGVVLVTGKRYIFYYNVGIFLFVALTMALVASVADASYTFDSTWRWYLISFVACIFTLISASDLKAADPKAFHRNTSHCLWIGSLTYSIVSLLKYYGVLAMVSPMFEPSVGRLSGVWGQPNLTTTICWLGLLAGGVSYVNHHQKYWWYASILVFGWTLACSASRMSWLMAAGLLALVAVSRLPRYQMSETLVPGRVLVRGTVAVIILLLVAPPLNMALQNFLVSLGLLEQTSMTSLIARDAFQDSTRLTELSKVLSEVQTFSWSQWFFGIGPGNYPVFSYRADMGIQPEGLVAGTWLHSHNIFTMVFVEFGLSGLIVLLAFLTGITRAALKPPMSLPVFFSVGGIGLIFIHSNLEFPLWHLWFLILFCLLLTNLFKVRKFQGDSKWLKPTVGMLGFLMVLALLVNTGTQYVLIVDVALKPSRDQGDYQRLSILANDSLMGPYSILRRYMDFAPDTANIDRQLEEVQKIKLWQPRDLVVLREFSLLVLKQDVPEACAVAKQSAYRYPRSAPIMLDHSLLSGVLSPSEVTELANCIEKGLAPRGETIFSMREKNKLKMIN